MVASFWYVAYYIVIAINLLDGTWDFALLITNPILILSTSNLAMHEVKTLALSDIKGHVAFFNI